MYDLSRFTNAQKHDYETALAEIRSGRKRSHWMWYIFPQIQGLGRSQTAQFYAIRDLGEAAAYLNDPYLGKNIREISKALLEIEGSSASRIFGSPDDMKLRSSMTLFALASQDNQVFRDVLAKYYHGKMDERTVKIVNAEK